MDNPQPSPLYKLMTFISYMVDAVHRLNVGGFFFFSKKKRRGLKI